MDVSFKRSSGRRIRVVLKLVIKENDGDDRYYEIGNEDNCRVRRC